MHLTWSRLRDGFRTNLWPIPTLGVLAALVLGLVLPEIDRRTNVGESDLIFGGGADAARTVLDAISSSMITVTSLTFSLTVVTLQLASSQFSPRLLRAFTRDLVVQCTLGLFLGTFTYALTVLRSVRTGTSGDAPFVPGISVTVGFVLALASVLALVFFLAHLTRTIRVESMLRGVHEDASQLAARTSQDDRISPSDAQALVPAAAVLLTASSSGFLTDVDERDLVSVACSHDAVVFVERHAGDPVVAGTPIGLGVAQRPWRVVRRGVRRAHRPGLLAADHGVRAHGHVRRRPGAAPADRRGGQGVVAGHQRPDHRGARTGTLLGPAVRAQPGAPRPAPPA